MKTACEWKVVSLTEKEVINQQMSDRNDIEQSKTSINCSFKFFMLRPMHPLKNWKYKNRNRQSHCNNLINQSYLQVTIHSIIQWWECTSSDQYTDPSIIKTAEYLVGFYKIKIKITAWHGIK